MPRPANDPLVVKTRQNGRDEEIAPALATEPSLAVDDKLPGARTPS